MARTVLALDCATEYCSVSLLVNDQIIDRVEKVGNGHSSVILPWIDQMLEEAGLTPADVQGVIFGAGPGSFTGVRVACGVAQGFSWGIGAEVLPLCNLLGTAWSVLKETSVRVAVVNDARMNECYAAVYENDAESVRCVVEPMLIKPENVPAWLQEHAVQRVVGTGCDAYDIAPGIDSQTVHSHARDLLQFWQTHQTQCQSQWVAPALASPLYVRNRVALTIQERAQGERL